MCNEAHEMVRNSPNIALLIEGFFMSNTIYLTPGPAQLFYTVHDHLKKAIIDDIPSVSHRSRKFIDIVTHTNECLKELLELPDEYDIFFLNSANEAWDRIIQNLVIEKSHHFVNGAFSRKFYDFSMLHGMKSSIHQVEDGFSFSTLKVPEDTELIGITKNETSVGYSFSEEDILNIRMQNPEQLIALDVVSACPSLPVNFKHIDTAYFSVQKGFGLPPGLGVWICNQKCQEKAKLKSQKVSLGSYRTLPNLKIFSDKNQTPETPNTLFIYLLGKITEDMVRTGRQRIIDDTIYKSTILYQAITNHPLVDSFVKSEHHRSKTTIVAQSNDPSKFISAFEKKGIVLGTGYGIHKNKHVRIANFPTHSKEVMEMICDMMNKIE